jgi:hypothetical protein
MDTTHRFLEQLMDEYWPKVMELPQGSVESNGNSFMLYHLRDCRDQPFDYITARIGFMINVSLDHRQYTIIRKYDSPERADAVKEIHMKIVERLMLYLQAIGTEIKHYQSQQQTFLQDYPKEVSI